HAVPWDAADVSGMPAMLQGARVVRGGRILAWLDASASAGAHGTLRSVRGVAPILTAVCSATLSPEHPAAWQFTLPLYPEAASRTAPPPRFESLARTARTMWRERLASCTQLTLPDSLVVAGWRAARVTLLLCQERFGEDWAPMGNPFQYRDVWL